jgi:ABC-2 type transport system permease protein
VILWRQATAFLRRDALVESSYRSAAVFGFAGRLSGVVVFFFLGRAVGDAPSIAPWGGDWFAFALLGLLLQEPLHAALSELAAKVRDAQLTGTLEAVLATPIGPARAIVLSALFPLVMSVVRLVLLGGFAIAALGVRLDPAGLPVALLALALALVAYASLGLLAASFTLVLKRGDPVASLVHVLSGLLAGVLYPVSVLPGPLQAAAQVLPLTHALDAVRSVLLPGADPSLAPAALLRLAGLCVVVVPLGVVVFRAAVRRARSDGSLTHY